MELALGRVAGAKEPRGRLGKPEAPQRGHCGGTEGSENATGSSRLGQNERREKSCGKQTSADRGPGSPGFALLLS